MQWWLWPEPQAILGTLGSNWNDDVFICLSGPTFTLLSGHKQLRSNDLCVNGTEVSNQSYRHFCTGGPLAIIKGTRIIELFGPQGLRSPRGVLGWQHHVRLGQKCPPYVAAGGCGLQDRWATVLQNQWRISAFVTDNTGQQKKTFFKTRLKFIQILLRNGVLNTMMPSDFP